MSQLASRLPEMDILRALAILLIVLGHLHDALALGSNPIISISMAFLAISRDYIVALGLALFFFISGFVIYRSNPNTATRTDVVIFFKKRVLRIFPLYWIALVVYFFVFDVLPLKTAFITYNPLANWFLPFLSVSYPITDVAIFALGLQGVLLRFVTHPMPGLWFIGVVLIYYVIYPLINNTSPNRRKFIVNSVVLFGLLLIVQQLTHSVEPRLFTYYGTFVGGIFACKFNIFSASTFAVNKQSVFKTALQATCFLVAAIIIFGIVTFWSGRFYAESLYFGAFALVAENVSYFMFSLFACHSVRVYIVASKRTSFPLLFSISFASYAVYLFYIPLLIVLGLVLMNVFHLTELQIDMVLVLLGLPSVFVACYFLQQSENKAMKKIATYIDSKRVAT